MNFQIIRFCWESKLVALEGIESISSPPIQSIFKMNSSSDNHDSHYQLGYQGTAVYM